MSVIDHSLVYMNTCWIKYWVIRLVYIYLSWITISNILFQAPVQYVDQMVLKQALSAPVITVASPSAVQ